MLVSEILMSRLAPGDEDALLSLLERDLPDAARNIRRLRAADNRFEYVREVLRYGINLLPERFEKTGISPAQPPETILLLGRREHFAGDFFFCDLITETIAEQSLTLGGGPFLDFGCASGRIVRNLAAAYPEKKWYGCDPRREAIEWAAPTFPAVFFYTSSQEPPLPFASEFFEGVFACSIWTHFSERAAKVWIDEMCRIIKPGGWLLLTTSDVSLVDRDVRPAEREQVKSELADRGISYVPAFQGKSFDLDATDWGFTFMTPAWVEGHLLRGWTLLTHKPGRNQGQDVFLFRRD